MLKRILLIALLAGVLTALLVYSQQRRGPLVVSGFIEADEIRLGSRVGGRVAVVRVQEGQAVSAGEVLVELDPFDVHERRAEAAALLAQARAELSLREAGFRAEEIAQAQARRDRLKAVLDKLVQGPRQEDIAAARALVALADAELDLARARHDRVMQLSERAASNPDEVDEAVRSLKVAMAQQAARAEELSKLLAGTRPEEIAEAQAQLAEAEAALKLATSGYRAEEILEARAAVEAAQQRVQAIDRQIAELTIRAPVDGVIETMDLQPGDLAPVNAPVISMMDRSSMWVRAYVPEDRMDIEIGRAVAVTVDSRPGERFAGHVGFLARQAEFTPGNVQTPEDRSRQVFRIKVILDEGRDVLRPGMGADVWLDGSTAPVAGGAAP
jgi:multidrug resistance efflux pump